MTRVSRRIVCWFLLFGIALSGCRSQNPDRWRVRGFQAYNQGRYEQSLRDYNEAIRLDPSEPTAYINRGVTYWKLRRYDEALADGRHALALRPDDASAWGNLGAYQYHLGRYEEARRNSRKALQLDSSLTYVRFNLGLIEATEGDWKAAREEYELGLPRADRATIEGAIEQVQEALQQRPNTPALKQALHLLQDRALTARAAPTQAVPNDRQSTRLLGY